MTSSTILSADIFISCSADWYIPTKTGFLALFKRDPKICGPVKVMTEGCYLPDLGSIKFKQKSKSLKPIEIIINYSHSNTPSQFCLVGHLRIDSFPKSGWFSEGEKGDINLVFEIDSDGFISLITASLFVTSDKPLQIIPVTEKIIKIPVADTIETTIKQADPSIEDRLWSDIIPNIREGEIKKQVVEEKIDVPTQDPTQAAAFEQDYVVKHPCSCGGNWKMISHDSPFPSGKSCMLCECEDCGRRKKFLFRLW